MRVVVAVGFLVAVLSACGGSGPSPTADGGDDGPASSGDSDGDGVTDDSDVCPRVADPAQIDLDHDGIGWACDPVESIAFGNGPALSGGSVSSDKAAAITVIDCLTPPCESTLFEVSNEGTFVVSSLSTDPADAWAHDAFGFAGPEITADGQMLFRRYHSYSSGDTIAVDPKTKQVQIRGSAPIGSVLHDGLGAPLLLSLYSPVTGAQLVEPRNGGQLDPIATTSTDDWFATSSVNGSARATEANPFVIEGATSGAQSLLRYQFDTHSLVALDPPVTGSYSIQQLDTGRGARWCVGRADGSTAYYEPTATGMNVVSLPFSRCGLDVRPFAGTTLFSGFGRDANGDGVAGQTVAFERAGVLHDVIVDDATGWTRVRTFGEDTIVVVLDRITPNPATWNLPAQVWVIWPDNTVALLADDLADVNASVASSTVHVIGVASGGNASGPLVVRRFKEGQPAESAQLLASVSTSSDNRVVTSVEGAAIASSDSAGWISPSDHLSFPTTSSPTLKRVGGGARGSHTVVFTGVAVSGFGGDAQGEVYAYDEVNAQPRLTLLATDGPAFDARLLRFPPADVSEYFAFGSAPACVLGRIQGGGSIAPTLDTYDCISTAPGRIELVGVTHQGEWVVSQGGDLRALSSAGVRVIARGARVLPILDRTENVATLEGWVANTGSRTLVCIDEEPLRCWSAPADARVIDARIERTAGTTNIAVLLLDQSTTNRFTVVRSIGPGDAQP